MQKGSFLKKGLIYTKLYFQHKFAFLRREALRNLQPNNSWISPERWLIHTKYISGQHQPSTLAHGFARSMAGPVPSIWSTSDFFQDIIAKKYEIRINSIMKFKEIEF